MMEGQTKAKVTARVEYDRARPPSPFKPHIPTLSPPAIKPRAKVNSSATVVNRKIQVSRTASPAPSARSPPSARAPSPFKPSFSGLPHSGSATSVSGARSRLTARPLSQQSPITGPESRQRSLTTVPSDSALSSRAFGGRPRRGSVSSHASLTVSPTHAELRTQSHRQPMSPSENGSPLPSPLSSPHPPATKVVARVKSKVSSVASSSPHTSPPASTSPSVHSRGPSIPSISLAAPLLPADINASPVPTSGHPFSTLAGDSPTQKHVYQPLASLEDVVARYGNYTVTAKVDPAAIPLPPQSPPMSTVSFSSRSSASRSSISYEHGTDVSRSTAPTVHSRVNGHSKYARASMDGSDVHSDVMTPSEDESWDDEEITKVRPPPREDPDRKVKDEAKSNRKIADLEISNKSLLAINATLEAQKHKQAKEIRELKRKLRESRLILPPPAYRAVKSSLPHDDTLEEEDEEEGEEDEEEERQIIEGKDDEPYRRVKAMVETLLETCQRALQTKPEDFVEKPRSGAKVLTAEEVRSWRGDETLDEIDPDTSLTDDRDDGESTQMDVSGDAFALLNAMRQGAEARHDSEDEVETSLLVDDDDEDDDRSLIVPPITVTPSS